MEIKPASYAALLGFLFVVSILPVRVLAEDCEPTEPDMLGPFYKPNAPVRGSVGQGYVLQGRVKAASTCSPIAAAKIEFWLAGEDGRYDADHRATVFSDVGGTYRFTSNFPQAYTLRPPHIHIRVTAENFMTLVTQHYPQPGTNRGSFDLVLRAGH